ncbi:hypothetical protein LC76P1_00161 [Lysinibacillus phage LC76P1]|nr:hypothetical protein LC76P1_00161 [Lysinibacillus phage LC76P1]
MVNIRIENDHFDIGSEELETYCLWLKNKNNVVLHLLEELLKEEGVISGDLGSNAKTKEIRNMILDVSGDISRLPSKAYVVGDNGERL